MSTKSVSDDNRGASVEPQLAEPRVELEEQYAKYFVPNDSIPRDRQFAGFDLRQPELSVDARFITVYDSDDALTF